MKNKSLIVLSTLFSVSLVACSSCAAPSPIEQPTIDSSSSSSGCNENSCPFPIPPDAGEDSSVITQENWQFTLPGPDWIAQPIPLENLKVHFKNQNNGAEIFLFKNATTDTYAEYIVNILRSLSAGGSIINSSQEVIVNDNKFILVQTSHNNTAGWFWNTVKNGYGYIFSCGGEVTQNDTSLHDLCISIGGTIQIK